MIIRRPIHRLHHFVARCLTGIRQITLVALDYSSTAMHPTLDKTPTRISLVVAFGVPVKKETSGMIEI